MHERAASAPPLPATPQRPRTRAYSQQTTSSEPLQPPAANQGGSKERRAVIGDEETHHAWPLHSLQAPLTQCTHPPPCARANPRSHRAVSERARAQQARAAARVSYGIWRGAPAPAIAMRPLGHESTCRRRRVRCARFLEPRRSKARPARLTRWPRPVCGADAGRGPEGGCTGQRCSA